MGVCIHEHHKEGGVAVVKEGEGLVGAWVGGWVGGWMGR